MIDRTAIRRRSIGGYVLYLELVVLVRGWTQDASLILFAIALTLGQWRGIGEVAS